MIGFLAKIGMAAIGLLVLFHLALIALAIIGYIIGAILTVILFAASMVLAPLVIIFEPLLIGFGIMKPTETEDHYDIS